MAAAPEITGAVLVTGGAGFIGAHVCKALADGGLHPVAFDDLSAGFRQAVLWGGLVEGDIRDEAALARAMRDHDVVAVVHLAGLVDVGQSVREPDRFHDQNVGGSRSVLAAMRRSGVRRLVFSSSAAVYGWPADGAALTEDSPTAPVSPYGETKLAGERLIAAGAEEWGLSGVALRYFNAAGSDPRGRIGESRHPETHLIPLAVDAALGLGPGLTLFGDDFDTPDGSCVRDYVHVDDVAACHLAALSATGEAGFTAFNLGTGRGHSVREVIAAVGRAAGAPVPFSVGPRRPGDPPSLVADSRRARDALGFRPARPDLDLMAADAVLWRRAPRYGLTSGV